MQRAAKPGARNPEAMVGFWINRASRSLIRRTDARLRSLGFAVSYLPVLRALSETRTLSQKELAQLARVEQPTMVETLMRMQRDGLVRRRRNPVDRRGNVVSLTSGARNRFAKARAVLAKGEREAVRGLRSSEQALLRTLLQHVVENVEADELTR